MTEVIVLGEHLLNTLGQIRSLGEIGIQPTVIWIENGYHSPKGSKYIKSFFPVRGVDEGLHALHALSGDTLKVVSTDSDRIVAALDREYDLLRKEHFFFFNAGIQGRLSLFLDKKNQCEVASRNGFKCPESYAVSAGSIPAGVRYPVFTKAICSLSPDWKNQARICNDEQELAAFLKSQDGSRVLVQEYIPKDNEVAIEGVSFNGGRDVFLPVQGEYYRLPEDGFGSFKYNEPFSLGDDFKNRIVGVLREIGYSGVFEIEFLKDKTGQLFFLEINFRHTQYNHALTDMGVNLSRVWLKSCVEGFLSVDEEVIRKDKSSVINEIKDYRTYVKTGILSRKAWLRDLFSADSYYLFDRKDRFFIVRYFCTSLKLSVRKLIHGLGRNR